MLLKPLMFRCNLTDLTKMSFKIFLVLLNLLGAFVFAQVPPGYGALMGALADARSSNVSQG